MSKYIDAEILKERLIKNIALTNALDVSFSEAPTIDIIRCKDCNNADYAGCPKGRCYCMEHGTYFNSDDYCSYGERQGN